MVIVVIWCLNFLLCGICTLTLISFNYFFFLLFWNPIIKLQIIKININFFTFCSFFTFFLYFLIILNYLRMWNLFRTINTCCLFFNFLSLAFLWENFFLWYSPLQLKINFICKHSFISLNNRALIINMLLGLAHHSTLCKVLNSFLIASLLHIQ